MDGDTYSVHLNPPLPFRSFFSRNPKLQDIVYGGNDISGYTPDIVRCVSASVLGGGSRRTTD